MAEYLVIHLSADANAQSQWIAVDDTGACLSSPASGPLSAASSAIGDRRVIVLVPGVDVLSTSIDIPLKSMAKIQAALPFALEDSVADDIDDLHFAAGPRRENRQIPVSVVRRDKLQAWIDTLADAGISPDSIIAENQALAVIPGTLSLLLGEKQMFINNGADIELALQDLGPAAGLAAIGAMDEGQSNSADDVESGDANTPRHVLVYGEPGAEKKHSHEWIAIRHEFDSVDIKTLADGILPRLAITVGAGAGVNLLQGSFGVKSEYAGLFQPWKYAAILLLALTGMTLAAKSVDYYQLSRLESSLQELFLTEYQTIVPGATEVRDPAAVIASLRKRSSASGGAAPELLLQSLEQLSRALQSNQTAHIEAISYRAGVVDIRLSAPSVTVLDNIRQLIDESDIFNARILSTNQDGDTVMSRIQIQALGV